jgi:uncharacterized protein (DUF305 family)
METKPLIYGIIGFLVGGLLVSIAATTFNKPSSSEAMKNMVSSLEDKQGDDYDAAFIDEMIMHHQGAIDMAKLSAKSAKHQEIKDMSRDIINAQEQEIDRMKTWRATWNYEDRSNEEM